MQNFGNRVAEACRKITQHNSKLNDSGNAFKAGNGLIEEVIYNPIGIELVFNAAVVRGGAKIAASTAKKTATIGKDVKRFAKSEDGSLPPPTKTSRNTQKSDSKHKSSDNDSATKNAAKAEAAGSAQTAKNAGKSNQQAVKSDGKSASGSTAGKAATSTEGSSAASSVRIQHSSGGKFSSSLGIGSLSGAGSFAVGKFVPANGPTAVREIAKKYKGGAHANTKSPKGDGLDSHHCPAKDCYKSAPISDEFGPAIKMEPKDHRLTASYGRSKSATLYRQEQANLLKEGKLMDAIEMDVKDIRNKFGNKYDSAIKDMLEYAETLNPKDFYKKGK